MTQRWTALFVALSAAFLLAFRLGNRFGFEVPIWLRTFVLLVVACVFVIHGLRTRGRHGLLRATACITIVAAAAEWIGLHTNLLFGNYQYTDQLGPMLPAGLPIAIPIFWLIMLTAADDLAGLALPQDASRLTRAFSGAWIAMTWDVMVDPIAVAYGCWIWTPVGAVFGIPATNAPSWFATAFVALILANPRHRKPSAPETPMWFVHLPAIALVGAAANNLAASFELGFPGAGLVACIGLAPYMIAAAARMRSRSPAAR